MNDLDRSISSQEDIDSTGLASVGTGACACGDAGVGEGAGACGDAGACACADRDRDVSRAYQREASIGMAGTGQTNVSRATEDIEDERRTDISREPSADEVVGAATAAGAGEAVSAHSSGEDKGHPTFDTFIFDLDGTLLDTLPDLVLLTNAVLRESGFPERTPEEILRFVGNGVKALMYQAIPEDAGEVQVEEAMKRWKAQYPDYGHRLTQPYPGIPETVAELKHRGVKLGVLSNKFDGAVCEVIDAYLPGLFTVTHGECDEIPRKPDPAGLLRTVDELGSTPVRAVYVGDSAGDVRVARNAGTFVIGVSWGYHGRARLTEAGADVIVDRPEELLAYAPGR